MKINFNPVSFKGNSPVHDLNGKPVEDNPMMAALRLDSEHAAKAKNKVELFNYRLHDDNWSKVYDNSTKTLHIKFPNSFDGTEYDVTHTGKVIESDGWSSPRVILDKHEELGKYVLAMKDFQMQSAGTFTPSSQSKDKIGFGSGEAFEGFTNPINTITTPKTPVDSGVNASESAAVQPEKKTVETPLDKTAEETPKKKTTLKEKFANVWKFFANLGQMTKAVGKGLLYGSATAASLLAGSWLFNTLPKAFTKEGPKLMQVIKHPITHIGKSGKIIAGIGAALVMAYHLIAGRLTANQRTADIDHKLHVGHRDV